MPERILELFEKIWYVAQSAANVLSFIKNKKEKRKTFNFEQ